MPPKKKRNYKQFKENQLIQPTLHDFGIDTVDKKYKRNLNLILLEAKQDFQDCLVRLQNFSARLDGIIQDNGNDDQEEDHRNHLSLIQRRKRFQQQLMKNPFFQLMVKDNPHLLEKTNFELKYLFSLINQQLTYSKIAMRVGVKVSSVVNVVRQYVQQDAIIKISNKRVGRQSKLTPIQIQEICSTHQLKKQAHLSLEKRCDLIKEKYQVQISRFTLAKIYRENSVSYIKTHKAFYSKYTEEELTKQRLEFIQKLARFLHIGQEIVYMDETSTNVWETKNKIWQPTNSQLPMVYSLPNQRGSNVTIIGAVSNLRNRIYFTTSKTTNTQSVLFFFQHLNQQIGLKNKVIVMDNHAAHHSKAVTEYIEKHKGFTLFMPPISSYFNPIETIWSWVKQKWRNQLIQNEGLQPTRNFMISALSKICDEAPPVVVTNIANSCISFMQKYYQEFSARQIMSSQ